MVGMVYGNMKTAQIEALKHTKIVPEKSSENQINF